MTNRNRDWLILTCSNCKTLALAESLAEAGFAVWAPRLEVNKRVGRQRNREVVKEPLLSGVVFATIPHAWDLIELSRAPVKQYQIWDGEKRRMVTKGHPHFRVFRENGEVGRVADRALDPLRLEEQSSAPKSQLPTFDIGDEVKHPANGFEGMVGKVERAKGRLLLVCFSDPGRPEISIPIEIDPCRLIAA